MHRGTNIGEKTNGSAPESGRRPALRSADVLVLARSARDQLERLEEQIVRVRRTADVAVVLAAAALLIGVARGLGIVRMIRAIWFA